MSSQKSVVSSKNVARALVFATGLVLAGTAQAHLCDNVFRQKDKLIVKPETYNLMVKDQTTFKIFLQNNMDRGIAEIALEAESKAFDFDIKPKIMSIPRDQRAFFQVTMKAKPATKTGNYPINFRLVGGGRVFKTFSIEAKGANGKTGAKTSPAQSVPAAATNAPKSASSDPSSMSGVLQARSASATPAIDGALNEPAWKTAAVFSNFSSSKGGRAVYNTTGLLLFDRQNLFFGFLCNDENPDALTENDYLEMRLSFSQSGTPCYIMRISPSGKVGMKRLLSGGLPADWMGTDIRFAIGCDKRAWTMEISIPFAAINEPAPMAVRKMFLRVARCKASGKAEDSYWSADQGGYNSEKGFGEISLVP